MSDRLSTSVHLNDGFHLELRRLLPGNPSERTLVLAVGVQGGGVTFLGLSDEQVRAMGRFISDYEYGEHERLDVGGHP